MARKGAMSKEPRREQPRRREGQPPMSPPVRATPPREKAMERLSPGVYRGERGGLVTQAGRAINRQVAPQRPLMRNVPQPMQPDTTQAGADAAQIAQMNNILRGYNQGGISLPQKPSNLGRSEGSSMFEEYLQNRQGAQPDFNVPMQMPDAQNAPLYNMPADKMYRFPAIPQMPEPSANMGGQYRLSPGVYGTRDQAMQQYNQQLAQMQIQPAMQGAVNAPANMPDINQFVPYGQRRG